MLNFCRTMPPAILLILLLLATVAVAQQRKISLDEHVSEDRARQLYRRSVFAHGYIHGYEDGFREGDIDFQTGHDPRALKRIKEFRAADNGYRRAFGDREQFRAAYRKGFVTAYTDALAGREFRGVAAVRRAAAGLPDTPEAANDTTFDQGFRQGYESGQTHGETAAHDRARYDSSPTACGPESPTPREPGQNFCDGYSRGYLMGYDDGYLTSGTKRIMTSRNNTSMR